MNRINKTACVILAVISLTVPASALASSLDLGSFELLFDEPVTASVTGMPVRESDVPVNMEIISADEIRNSSALNIPDVLRRLAGLDVIQWTDSHYDVGFRGYNQVYNPSILVLINGRQVYFNDLGRTAWTHLPVQMEDIRQIEVVRGPNTALFGFNAASGMINIVTFNPIYDQKGYIRTEFGSHGSGQISTSLFTGNFHGLGLGLSAGTSELSNHDTIGNAAFLPFEVDGEDENISLNGVYDISDRTQIALDGSYARSRYNEIEIGYGFSDSTYRSTSLRGRLFHDSDFGRWSFSAYENNLRARLQSPVVNILNRGAPLTGENKIRVISLQNEFIPFGNHSIRVYGEYRDNQIDIENNTVSQRNRFGYEVQSAGATWHWNEAGSFGLMASGRLDHLDLRYEGEVPFPLTSEDFDRDLTEPSYNLAALWRFSENDAARAGVARGVQTPSLFNLGLSFDPLPVLFNTRVIGNPQLDPTTVDTAEISYTRKLNSLSSEFKIGVFYQQYKDLGVSAGYSLGALEIADGVPVFRATEAGDANSKGVEAALDGKLSDNLIYKLNYTYAVVDEDLSVNEQNGANLDYPILIEDSVPKHRVNLQLGYQRDDWNADLFGFWQSGRRLLRNPQALGVVIDDINSEFNADARIGYKVGERIQLSLTATNILGDYQSTSDISIERRVLVGASIKLF